MSHSTHRSKTLFDRSLGVMIEGGSSASRGPADYGAYPLFLRRGEGARLFDVDGNSYVDLQDLARAHGILFILDETVTGFRLAPGGCQELYDLQPDISIFGKALGSGLPVAAFAGRADVMAALAWGGVLHYGTQNASRIGLHGARASLRVLSADGGAAYLHMHHVAQLLCDGLRDLFSRLPVAAIIQHVGPMMQVMFTDQPSIPDYRAYCRHVDRSRYQRFAQMLLRHGVYLSPMATLHSVVSLPPSEDDVAETLDAVRAVLTDGRG